MDFLTLSSPFQYMPFWNSPQSSFKIGKNVFGGQFLQLYCKNENGHNPYFLRDVLIRTVLPPNEKKIGTNLCSVVLAILTKIIVSIELSQVE